MSYKACLTMLVLLAIGCSDRAVQLARDVPDATADTATDSATDSAMRRDAQAAARCGDHVCACNDGLDNDGDGLVDGLDPECTGAFDDDEASFATSQVGPSALGPCRDCFFDGNFTSEDDGCWVHVACIDEGTSPPLGAGCAVCDVSKECKDNCRPQTPNGCDCFGCCTIDIKGRAKVNIRLHDTCSIALLDDEGACPRCVPNDACRNPCGRCELCPGRTAADLPKDCANQPVGPGHQCDDREAVCDEATPCPIDYYCLQGCCLPTVVL